MIASAVMASIVCGISCFLLRKSGDALLGQTLPGWRTEALVSRLMAHAAVVNVYDVKTEMVGTDTVRFKAEVQFNPQAITERVLQEDLHAGAVAACEEEVRLRHAAIAARSRAAMPPAREDPAAGAGGGAVVAR